ncbi:unnamed protein product [Periconia digitata]|uniref:Spherulation-specific family 4 n=1 Tax=Periconia digitata TaxID=1303443 RepID=A0A9W4UCR4_9PLEO|nr:unnamed protein product [Periconia digitata]
MAPPASKVLLPLYIYPDPGKWDPLFKAIEYYPSLDFIIIVNPNSGPGSDPWWPNADYVREIPKLNAFPNVLTIGYVATTYCKRNIEHVLQDIEKYAAWASDERFPGLGVSGIFFDETPNLHTQDVKSYLDAVSTKVKETQGILDKRLVIHNPGTTVQRALAEPGPDVTTSAEVAYRDFMSKEFQDWLALSPYGREQTSYMIHSIGDEDLEKVVLSMRERARYLFVTDLKVDFYHNFSTSWDTFVAAMASVSGAM